MNKDSSRNEATIKECTSALKKATGKERAAIFERMGDAYKGIGKDSKALVCYEQAVEVGGVDIGLIVKYTDLVGMSGDYGKAISFLEGVISKAQDAKVKARLQAKMAYHIRQSGRFEEAKRTGEAALEVLRTMDQNDQEVIHSMADATNIVGICYSELGRVDEMREAFERAFGLFKRVGDIDGMTRTKSNMGVILLERGDVDMAQKCFEEALRTSKSMPEEPFRGMILNHMGMIHHLRGEFDEAERCYKEGIALEKTQIRKFGVILAQADLADMYADKGDLVKAKGWADLALSGVKSVKESSNESWVLCIVAKIALKQGDLKAAEIAAERALILAKDIKVARVMALATRLAGVVAISKGDMKKAERDLRKSFEMYEHTYSKVDMARCRMHLASVLMAKGATKEAKQEAAMARSVFTELRAKADLEELNAKGF